MADIDPSIPVGQLVLTLVPSAIVGLGVWSVKKVFGDLEAKMAAQSVGIDTLTKKTDQHAADFNEKLDAIKATQAQQSKDTALHNQKIEQIDHDCTQLKKNVRDLELQVEKLTVIVEQLRSVK